MVIIFYGFDFSGKEVIYTDFTRKVSTVVLKID
jgi:hypothetical protein